MLKIFVNEFFKTERALKWIVFFIISFLCNFGIMYGAYFFIESGYVINYLEILLQILKIVSFVIPIVMLILTTDVFAKEFETGMMKVYLYSGKSRVEVFFGKVGYLIALAIIMSLVLFFQYSVISFIFGSSLYLLEYFIILLAYLSIGIGSIIFILYIVIVSIIIMESSITLISSIFLFLLLWVVNNSFLKESLLSPHFYLKFYQYIFFGIYDNFVPVLLGFLIHCLIGTALGLLIFKNKYVWR